ncbi:MAG: transglycosylase domain-containing protein, partial [Erysipelotrichaceae bacterium]|nr:transglycosylase domain-containing protein [Erysipelotrichaceae bacterium]
LFLNKVNFGNKIRGVEKASQYYFGKSARASVFRKAPSWPESSTRRTTSTPTTICPRTSVSTSTWTRTWNTWRTRRHVKTRSLT